MFVQAQDDYRLPTDVKPTHYDLTVRTDLETLKFDGIVKIHLDVQKDTSTIVLHTKELKLADVILFSASQTEQTPSSSAFDATNERTSFVFAEVLPAGSKAQLKIAFEAELTSSLTGYYRSASSATSEGQPKYYSLTQFEPTDARKAFPCYDEPLLKATFTITMVSRADSINLSNMSAASEAVYASGSESTGFDGYWISQKLSSAADIWKITRFETTPPVSTYLIAYANGHFEYLESSYTSPLSGKTRPLRIYTTADKIHQAQFALDIQRKVLPIYEQIFDIEYPLPKLDTLVVSDFDAAAMENWGLITGRASAFLVDEENANLFAKKNVAGTQGHEVAHMWFGNITTMQWWDNLYLNEGFATLIGEIIVLDKIFPEWKLVAGFVSGPLASALSLDAKLSSHPIEVDCPDPKMINQIFDHLSYFKAASVLRMLQNYVGEERFLKGVSIYLKKHLYANSVTRDLWEGIEAATGIDIPKMMDNWVKKIGYPVVTVTETEDGIHVRQDRFLETGPAKPEENETIWTIPLNLLTVSKHGDGTLDKEIILEEREKTIPLDTSLPFKLNAGTTGAYRVQYTPERLVKMATEAVKTPSPFSIEDRMGLASDAMELARAGFADVSSALSLIEVLCKDERDYLVWQSVSANLTEIVTTWWEYENITESMNVLRRELFAPIVLRLGYDYPEDEAVDDRQLRTVAVSEAAVAGEEGVIKELIARFEHYMKTGDDSRIHADLERAVYTTAVKYGGREEFAAMKKIIQKPKNPSANASALVALGYTQDLSLAKEIFTQMLEGAREQDLWEFFVGFSHNYKMRRFVVNAFKENYDTIYNKLSEGSNLRLIIQTIFGVFSTKKDHDEVVAFFKDKDVSTLDMTLKQTLENITTRTAWIERSTTDISNWLERRASGSKL